MEGKGFSDQENQQHFGQQQNFNYQLDETIESMSVNPQQMINMHDETQLQNQYQPQPQYNMNSSGFPVNNQQASNQSQTYQFPMGGLINNLQQQIQVGLSQYAVGIPVIGQTLRSFGQGQPQVNTNNFNTRQSVMSQCQTCGYQGMSNVSYENGKLSLYSTLKIKLQIKLFLVLYLFFCCYPCCCLGAFPMYWKEMKDAVHRCQSCHQVMGKQKRVFKK